MEEEKDKKIKKQNNRSFRIAPEVWPKFDALLDQLVEKAGKQNRVTKGDIATAAMRFFMLLDDEAAIALVLAFRNRPVGALATKAELDFAEKLVGEILDFGRSGKARPKKGKSGESR